MQPQAIVVPDRFESLERRAQDNLRTIIEPVQQSLDKMDEVFSLMRSTDRGAFLVLRGASGASKSTFLHTMNLYRENVRTISVSGGIGIREFFNAATVDSKFLNIFVLEEREAATSFSDSELEDWLHSINGFIRSTKGSKSLVVWPCNTDTLRDRIVSLAEQIGGESLIGANEKWHHFLGPQKEQYAIIAERTLATLNQGASFSDLGLTVEIVNEVSEESTTIGDFLTRLHGKISKVQNYVSGLIKKEQCRLWIVVAAGNDPAADVAGLTRGRFAAIDTERLLTSTGANVVSELRAYPDKIGIMGTVLDAKIMHLPVLTVSAIIRAFADASLQNRLKAVGFSLKPNSKSDALIRLNLTELAAIFQAGSQGTLARGPKLGSKSIEAFEKLSDIASSNDVALNRAIGRALVEAKLIDRFEVEQDFGTGLTRRTDILAHTQSGPIRVEVMWRKSTGRAEIANYTLTKVANYGKAIGFLN